jgi:hypothetical protein
MSSYFRSEGGEGFVAVSGGATGKPRRRRVVSCVGPEDDVAVEKYYADDSKSNDPLRYTTCMSHHVMARIEDDVKRAKMREDNPDSAIPSKGYDYDVDAYRAVEEYRMTQQLPRGSNAVAAALYTPPRTGVFLPALSPRPSQSTRTSNNNSRQPSRGPSTANSPSNQSRRSGPAASARRPGGQPSRNSTRVSQYPSAYRSPSSSKHKRNNARAASNSSSPPARLPAGGRLLPIIQTPQHSGFRDDGRVAGPSSGETSKAHRKLLLEPSSLGEEEEAVMLSDAERQRRLRLAEVLAEQMDAEAM